MEASGHPEGDAAARTDTTATPEPTPGKTLLRERTEQVAGRVCAAAAVAASGAIGVVGSAPGAEAQESRAQTQQQQEPGFVKAELEGGCYKTNDFLVGTYEVTHDADIDIKIQNPDGEDRGITSQTVSEGFEFTDRYDWEKHIGAQKDQTMYLQADFYTEKDETVETEPQTVEFPNCDGSGGENNTSSGDTSNPDNAGDSRQDNVGGPEYPINTEQRAGRTPAETAALASGEHFDPENTEQVVLATDQDFADALAGGPLAKAVGGPILFTGSQQLSSVTAQEIQRLNPREVLMLGGQAALAPEVAHELRNQGQTVHRLAGATRVETAREIDDYLRRHTNASVDEQFLVNGWKFADAMAAGGYAAGEQASIVLTKTGQLPSAMREHMEAHRAGTNKVTAVGGTGVVSSHALRQSGQAAGANTDRIAGATRRETSEEVAKKDYQQNGNQARDARASIYLAPSTNYYGALAAAPIEAQQENAALKLVHPKEPDTLNALERVVEQHKHTSWREARIIGHASSSAQGSIDQVLNNTAPVNG
jgi:putative cell wall-binding protein